MVKQDPCGPSVQDAIEKLPRIPAGYRDWVLSISAKMELLKLSVGDAPPVGLPEVYIPLYTDDFPRKTLDRVKDETPGHEETGKPPVDIEILISREPYLLLEGLPGSGKTTMIRHLARRMMLGEPPEGMDGFLPIVVFLSDLNRFLDEEGAPAPGDELLVRALGDYLGKKSLSTGEVLEYCRAGRALLMLDGLDELKEMHRPVLVRSLQHFREHNPMTRFVLTTRPHAVDVAKRYFGDRHREIHTLKREQKADFIHRWFAHLAGVRSTATEETAGALLERMDRIERMDELVDTPLMLTAICILYMDDKELPEQRADLYDRVVNNLLEKRFRPYEREDKRYNSMPELIHELLGRLAVLMMKKETRTVTMDEVLKAALDIKKGVFKQMGTEHADGYKTRLADLFRRIEGDCGLLDHGESGYNFRHLTFQEFLAAWRILSTSTDPWAGVEALVDDPLWQESIMLYVGLLAGGRMPMLARTVIEKLLASCSAPGLCLT
jgi:predicted NACHT family NTPase